MRTLWQRQPEPSAGPPSNPAELADRALHRRAIEAVIWGMPAVNFELMLRQMVKLGGAPNEVVFWSRPITWKNQTLTPNPDTIYFLPFFNTKDVGPVVLEIPPADTGTIVGSVDDCWQTAIADVGPAGADKGEGAGTSSCRPTIPAMPPTATSHCRRRHISPMRCCARTIAAQPTPTSPTRWRTGNAFGSIRSRRRTTRRRPHSSTRSTSCSTRRSPTTRGFSSAEQHRADRAVADPRQGDDRLLKTIGIEKGRPFAPDDKTRRIFNSPRTKRTRG